MSGSTAGPTTGPTTVDPASRCHTSDLRLAVGRGLALGGATFRLWLILTNAGPAPCSLYGYPGVALIADDGSSYDLPRSTMVTPTRIGLEPGGSAAAALTYRTLAREDDDNAFMPASITVTPPDEWAPLRARWIRGEVRDDRGAARPATVIAAFTRGAGPPP
jgi:hypothetical protein